MYACMYVYIDLEGAGECRFLLFPSALRSLTSGFPPRIRSWTGYTPGVVFALVERGRRGARGGWRGGRWGRGGGTAGGREEDGF